MFLINNQMQVLGASRWALEHQNHVERIRNPGANGSKFDCWNHFWQLLVTQGVSSRVSNGKSYGLKKFMDVRETETDNSSIFCPGGRPTLQNTWVVQTRVTTKRCVRFWSSDPTFTQDTWIFQMEIQTSSQHHWEILLPMPLGGNWWRANFDFVLRNCQDWNPN